MPSNCPPNLTECPKCGAHHWQARKLCCDCLNREMRRLRPKWVERDRYYNTAPSLTIHSTGRLKHSLEPWEWNGCGGSLENLQDPGVASELVVDG